MPNRDDPKSLPFSLLWIWIQMLPRTAYSNPGRPKWSSRKKNKKIWNCLWFLYLFLKSVFTFLQKIVFSWEKSKRKCVIEFILTSFIHNWSAFCTPGCKSGSSTLNKYGIKGIRIRHYAFDYTFFSLRGQGRICRGHQASSLRQQDRLLRPGIHALAPGIQ